LGWYNAGKIINKRIMAQNDSENKEGFFAQYQIPIIVAVILLVAIIGFAVNRGQNSDQNQNDQNNGQASNPQPSPAPAPTPSETPSPTPTPGSANGSNTDGNITAKGVLRTSDNATRGNLMVESASGKIYIATVRDFSSLVGKEVTLNAQGSLNNFAFLGFNEAVAEGPDVGGSNEGQQPPTDVSFTGTLKVSDNLTRGNYLIQSGNTKVYLKTVRDYSALVDSEVVLTASGTLNSFTNARVVKK
jgi:hypothetical protein